MVRRLAGSLLRRALDRAGYVLWKRQFIQYGILPFLDVNRLAAAAGVRVRTVFDVGANVGQTSAAALAAFPEARVFAFEPHPETFSRLRASLVDDRLSLHELALSDTSGDQPFYEYGQSGGAALMNSLVPDARFPRLFGYSPLQKTVPCETIDRFCDAHDVARIDLLKIDAEGHELAVIQGAGRMLAEGRIGFIYAEFNDLLPKEGASGGSLLPLAEYLAPFGVRYVAAYTDFIVPDAGMFVSANVLFARSSLAGEGADR